MVQLATNQPHRSKVPQIVVENRLKPGRYRMSLVVIDDAQNESEPFELTVTVDAATRPIDRIRRPTPINPLRPRRPT